MYIRQAQTKQRGQARERQHHCNPAKSFALGQIGPGAKISYRTYRKIRTTRGKEPKHCLTGHFLTSLQWNVLQIYTYQHTQLDKTFLAMATYGSCFARVHRRAKKQSRQVFWRSHHVHHMLVLENIKDAIIAS